MPAWGRLWPPVTAKRPPIASVAVIAPSAHRTQAHRRPTVGPPVGKLRCLSPAAPAPTQHTHTHTHTHTLAFVSTSLSHHPPPPSHHPLPSPTATVPAMPPCHPVVPAGRSELRRLAASSSPLPLGGPSRPPHWPARQHIPRPISSPGKKLVLALSPCRPPLSEIDMLALHRISRDPVALQARPRFASSPENTQKHGSHEQVLRAAGCPPRCIGSRSGPMALAGHEGPAGQLALRACVARPPADWVRRRMLMGQVPARAAQLSLISEQRHRRGISGHRCLLHSRSAPPEWHFNIDGAMRATAPMPHAAQPSRRKGACCRSPQDTLGKRAGSFLSSYLAACNARSLM